MSSSFFEREMHNKNAEISLLKDQVAFANFRCKLFGDLLHAERKVKQLEIELINAKAAVANIETIVNILNIHSKVQLSDANLPKPAEPATVTPDKNDYEIILPEAYIANVNLSNSKIHQKWKCKECSQIFTNKSNILQHIRAVHRLIRFNCSICSKSFSRPNNCRNHMRSIHHKY